MAFNFNITLRKGKSEDHWSCIAHLRSSSEQACTKIIRQLEFVFYMKTDLSPPPPPPSSPYWNDGAFYSILQRGIESYNK